MQWLPLIFVSPETLLESESVVRADSSGRAVFRAGSDSVALEAVTAGDVNLIIEVAHLAPPYSEGDYRTVYWNPSPGDLREWQVVVKKAP